MRICYEIRPKRGYPWRNTFQHNGICIGACYSMEPVTGYHRTKHGSSSVIIVLWSVIRININAYPGAFAQYAIKKAKCNSLCLLHLAFLFLFILGKLLLNRRLSLHTFPRRECHYQELRCEYCQRK